MQKMSIIRSENMHSHIYFRHKNMQKILNLKNIYDKIKKVMKMLKRKIEKKLLEWKQKEDKMCLVIKGARQVGKTFIIDKFAKENYKNYVYINFDEMPSYKDIFDGDLNPETLIKQMTVNIPNINLTPNETIIVLDEIQNCPRARTALKFLSIDKRFDVIASGSLLGINYKDVPSFPVGYVETLEMHSLDFE